jgi:hypothetical protein
MRRPFSVSNWTAGRGLANGGADRWLRRYGPPSLRITQKSVPAVLHRRIFVVINIDL